MNWHMGMALGGIRLQVPDSQLVRALEVLDDFRQMVRKRLSMAK